MVAALVTGILLLRPSDEAPPVAPSPTTSQPAETGSPDGDAASDPDADGDADATPEPEAPPVAAADIDDPDSYSVVVNKLRPLSPIDYAPSDLVSVPVPHTNTPTLRADAASAVVEMFEAFSADTGLQLQSLSAYRPYSTQVSIYENGVATQGREFTDTVSARPGHSEHQTGLAIDVGAVPSTCDFQACFGDTPQGLWVAENAHRFGFIVRYPEGLTHITGFVYEPWHLRYVGVDLAGDLRASGVPTLEEYFGLPAAPDYAS